MNKSKNKDTNYWLKEGEQSKITKNIQEIISKFKGNDFEKITQSLNWIISEKNLTRKVEYKKIIKIFATRTAEKIIKDKYTTGCHDDAVILAVFLKGLGIPTKYLMGINRLKPRSRGHCVVEAYVNKKWILIDTAFCSIYLEPEKSEFYRENYVMEEGLDSWDIGIKTFKSWKEKSFEAIKINSKVKEY